MLKDIVFNSLENAGNYIKDLMRLTKKRAAAEDFPINTSTPREEEAYLLYGISLLDVDSFPAEQKAKIKFLKRLLQARAKGYGIQYIARMSGCSVETAKKWEREGMERVKEAINKKQKHGIPILGGAN